MLSLPLEQSPSAVFNCVSQVIQNYFGIALLRAVIGYKKKKRVIYLTNEKQK